METGKDRTTGGQPLGHSLLAHGTDSRDAGQMFRAMEESSVPVGRAVSQTFAPFSALAAVLAVLSLPLCEKRPEVSSPARPAPWQCGHRVLC